MSKKKKKRDLETLKFSYTVDHATFKKHKERIERISKKEFPDCEVGDTLVFDYSLYIEYFNDVRDCLEDMCEILKSPGGTVSVTTKELKRGRCLIEEVFNRLRDLEQLKKQHE